MPEKLKYLEPDKKKRKIEIVVLLLLIAGSIFSFSKGFASLSEDPGDLRYVGTVDLERQYDLEDYDEDSTVCDVVYVKDDKKLVVSYPYEEYEQPRLHECLQSGYPENWG